VGLCLLCSAISWAEDYTGPPLPEGWYPISETELTELETILTRQEQTIERQATTLTELSTTIDEQRMTISRLDRFWTEYETEVTAQIRRLKVEIWAYRIGGIAMGALAIWAALR
jgi:uncharacterized coiled-coil protein SlyX